jgi:hypothetical protein
VRDGRTVVLPHRAIVCHSVYFWTSICHSAFHTMPPPLRSNSGPTKYRAACQAQRASMTYMPRTPTYEQPFSGCDCLR